MTLATYDPNHSRHVVRGMEPAQALRPLHAEAESIRFCILPDSKPNDRFSPFAALGVQTQSAAVLLAGRIGQ
ncbi:hypothetical protein ACFQ51_55045 [Streptomyces kaempferi]